MSQIPDLTSFSAVKNWDQEARNELVRIESILTQIPSYAAELKLQLHTAQKEFETKSFFKRLFGADAESLRIQAKLQYCEQYWNKLNATKESLSYWIDVTPDNNQEAQGMLVELKHAKKELGIRKKEVKSEMKGINAVARQKTANVSRQILFTNPKLRRIQRAEIRYEKETAIASHEAVVLSIERQMIEVERLMNWIERLKFDR